MVSFEEELLVVTLGGVAFLFGGVGQYSRDCNLVDMRPKRYGYQQERERRKKKRRKNKEQKKSGFQGCKGKLFRNQFANRLSRNDYLRLSTASRATKPCVLPFPKHSTLLVTP